MKVLHEIPQDEIDELDAITKRCHEIHAVPPTYATLEMEVTDKDGIKVARYADLSRSWTRNYYNIITMQTLGCALNAAGAGGYADGSLQSKSTAGDVRGSADSVATVSFASLFASERGKGYVFQADAARVDHGIVIGTDATAEAMSDYRMNTVVAEGTGAGQMSYQAMNCPVVTWDAGTRKFKAAVIRIIINNSGGSIGVKEVGLYAMGLYSTNQFESCVIRDKLGATITVDTAAQITVTYNLYSAAYPA